jgi:hypothetical protein
MLASNPEEGSASEGAYHSDFMLEELLVDLLWDILPVGGREAELLIVACMIAVVWYLILDDLAIVQLLTKCNTAVRIRNDF